MKKKLLFVLCFLIISITCLVSCGKKEQPKSYVYYINAEGTSIVQGEYQWKNEDPAKAAENIIEGMRNPKDSVVHRSAIPKKVEILKMDIDGGRLKIDFNQEYQEMKRPEEILLRAAIVGSMSQIKEIQYVEFTIEGTPLLDGEGEVVGAMSASDFVRDIGEELNSYIKKEFHLYYATAKGDALIEETANVRCNNNIPIEKIIVEQLQKNPKTKGSKVAVPPEAKLLGVSIKDRVCYINFDDGFLQPILDVSPEVTIYSIVNSVVDGGGVDKVQISVNGKKEMKFLDVIDLSKPFEKNDDIVHVEK